MLQGYLTVAQAAAKISLTGTPITPSALLKRIKAGTLRAEKFGNNYLIKDGSWKKWEGRPPGRPRKIPEMA